MRTGTGRPRSEHNSRPGEVIWACSGPLGPGLISLFTVIGSVVRCDMRNRRVPLPRNCGGCCIFARFCERLSQSVCESPLLSKRGGGRKEGEGVCFCDASASPTHCALGSYSRGTVRSVDEGRVCCEVEHLRARRAEKGKRGLSKDETVSIRELAEIRSLLSTARRQ